MLSTLSETINLIQDQQSQSNWALFVLFQNVTPPTFYHVKFTSAFCDVFYPKVSGARGKTWGHALISKSKKISLAKYLLLSSAHSTTLK